MAWTDVLGAAGGSGLAIGRRWVAASGETLKSRSPIDGASLADIRCPTPQELSSAIAEASTAFVHWRMTPAPARGALVRAFGEQLRAHKAELAEYVSLEAGKITQEALGEVQEMIDICEFAVGLSRQLHGLTIASERPMHRLMEQWHPLGNVGVISAFNFPVAVWAWNAALAWVCGDPVIWKPSEKTPLCALATHVLVQRALATVPDVPDAVAVLACGGSDIGQALVDNPRLPLISATGSVRMGRAVAQRVAGRLGRCLLELGGNNGMIVTPTCDLELALRAIVFSAVGTCGQRCTTLRRLIVHESIKDALWQRLCEIYTRLPIGDPTRPGTLIGPLVDQAAFDAMQAALAAAAAQGGRVIGGQRLTTGVPAGGFYVQPALVDIAPTADILQHETFAPILYVTTYRDLNVAIDQHNAVPQGLSSAIFTSDLREAELFLSPAGSDCGIANVNIGTSGAEIGGAFGGEKETGGGRESGSDSWKAYMRRATNTLNYGHALPLAQGIRFEI